MRLSSLVALVVVTSSLALGGCAANAEEGSASTDNVTHEGTASDTRFGADELLVQGKIGDGTPAALTDEARARILDPQTSVVGHARVDAQPPVFGHAIRPAKAQGLEVLTVDNGFANAGGATAAAGSERELTAEELVDVVEAHTVGTKKR